MTATQRALAKATGAFERCPTKLRYTSWTEAEEAALSAIEDQHIGKLKRLGKAGVLMAYLCHGCEGWHIGHFTSHVVRSAWTLAGAVSVTRLPRDWGIR